MIKKICLTSIVLMFSASASAGEDIELTFKNHLQKNMVEQHVYVERVAGSGHVYRVTPVDQHRYLNSPTYGTSDPIASAPLSHGEVGPYPRGTALGFALGEWLAATGTGHYQCDGDVGKVEAIFNELVPNGIYTFWYNFSPRPPLDPFTVLNMPLGARDGSQSAFRADADGHAEFSVEFGPCLQLSGRQVNTMLAIAWHSDEKTHGSNPGPFSTVSHVQLISDAFPIEGR